MRWNSNQYYPLVKTNKDTIQIAIILLQAYPLTQASLEILGSKLLEKLEFGFFTGGQEIIHEGDAGKDMYLLCEGLVDVLVNDQIVVQMESPALIGDKAMVEPNSKRAATIRVAEGETLFLIKIPMGTFIRSYKEPLPDSEFLQEVKIFSNIFQEIQKRLFNYVHLQKNLWEEVNTTLKILNSQFIAKAIDNRKELEWSHTTWAFIKKYLHEKYNFVWPPNVSTSVANLRAELYHYMETHNPPQQHRGSETSYITKLRDLWRGWLLELSESILQKMPVEERTFQLHDVELFNPRNYHIRVSSMLKNVERSCVPNSENIPKNTIFFGTGDQSHVFDLEQYLGSFSRNYSVKYPNRMQAQASQRLAMIAAECENQFNSSIAKMQKFLEKARSKSVVVSDNEMAAERVENQIQKYINMLLQGFAAFRKSNVNWAPPKSGAIRFSLTQTPTIKDLVGCSSSKTKKMEISHAFQRLTQIFQLQGKNVSEAFIRENFHFCEGTLGDDVGIYELSRDYWIPLSHSIALMRNIDNLGMLKPGVLLGGKEWASVQSGEDPGMFLRVNTMQSTLFMVLPEIAIPWHSDHTPNFDKFVNQYLPVMQWLLDKQIEHLLWWKEQKETVQQKVLNIQQIIHLEKRMKTLETSHVQPQPKVFAAVCRLLKSRFGISLDPNNVIHFDVLSKKLYNDLLQQIGQTFPAMPIEERGNKVYTQWRFILSEIVHLLEQLQGNKISIRTDSDVMTALINDFQQLDMEILHESKHAYEAFLSETPELSLSDMLKEKVLSNTDKMIEYFQKRLELLIKRIHQLSRESFKFQLELDNLEQQRPQTEEDSAKQEYISEQIHKLKMVLQK
ncbi:MAG: cyclic nucleotide-binding domain-containing protein [SAR324 cluster bacterium]|nr:cyclic nucleotide-binding domain-containing protein [SAR324 cluster bacterium]